MRADPRFYDLDKAFWANVRLISETLGYSERGKDRVLSYSMDSMAQALERAGLRSDHLISEGVATQQGEQLLDYVQFRADTLNNQVEPRLMDVEQAAEVFNALERQYPTRRPAPMNKQSGSKKRPAYFTGIVNTLIDAYVDGMPVVYDPYRLPLITQNQMPLRLLSRRFDGCFPSVIDPIAVWEIKEYYHTTTFGSRVADAVYETLLDGWEIEELRQNKQIYIEHVLMIDSRTTWWLSGRSYLCRLIDMLHMGYVDEILFGYEVVERLPAIAQKWTLMARTRGVT